MNLKRPVTQKLVTAIDQMVDVMKGTPLLVLMFLPIELKGEAERENPLLRGQKY